MKPIEHPTDFILDIRKSILYIEAVSLHSITHSYEQSTVQTEQAMNQLDFGPGCIAATDEIITSVGQYSDVP